MLSGPPTLAPISFCRRDFGRAPRLAAQCAQAPRDPIARAKKSQEQRWQVKMRVYLGKVNAITR